MELIHYADGSILTGSSIAKALLDYAQVLAANESAASLEIPIRQDDGSVGHATFLLGPASQIVAVTVESEFDEIVDDDLVKRLEAETDRQRGAEVSAGEQGPAGVAPTDLEWEE
ncbi:hypothetical protein [Frondihabitans peucedani]|uniref:Uncharacterized protein n=1 Tax=Frondihabitans peucedani TaxID=598626 RepID=A0ABP8E5A1_9MICO